MGLYEIGSLWALGLRESNAGWQQNLWGVSGPFGVKPVNVNIDITDQCCLKCQMCDVWKTHRGTELEIPAWIDLIAKLKTWLGSFRLTITGGEPFMKRGIWDLLDACVSAHLPVVVVTNGFVLNDKALARLLQVRLTQIVLSIDSVQAKVHEEIRGVPGSHARVWRVLEFLAKQSRSFVLATNTVIMRQNIRELAPIARGLAAAGVERMLFQPIQGGFSLEKGATWPYNSELWPDSTGAEEGIRQLIAAKSEGLPITNTADEMDHFIDYFREGRNWQRPWPCSVGYTTLHFDARGNARMCSPNPADVGNIQNESPQVIWASLDAEIERRRIKSCRRACVLNCNRTYSLREKVDMGWKFVKRQS